MKSGFLKNLTLKEALEKTITMLTNHISENQPSKEKKKRAEINRRYYETRFGKYKANKKGI